MAKRAIKPRCIYGIDTCDGPDGKSGFICRDCAEDLEPVRDPAKQSAGRPCGFCGEGVCCEHGYCWVCQACLECAMDGARA